MAKPASLENAAALRWRARVVVAAAGAGAGSLPLLLHQPFEPFLVDTQPLLGDHLEGQVDGEAEGVVEGEGVMRCDSLRSLITRACDQLIEHPGALL